MSENPDQPRPSGPQGSPKPQDAVQMAADHPDALDAAHAAAALEWFLSPEPETVASKWIEMNVSVDDESWVPFKIAVVPREEIRRIRKESEQGQGENREVNELEANLRIAVEGLLTPDLGKPENRNVRGTQHIDPAGALQARFIHKPGLIDQLAGAVVNASGYNEKDVREVRAAGN